MKKIHRDNLLEHLVEKMFNELELTTFDAIFEPKWRDRWHLTKDQHKRWKKYCIQTMKKVLHCNTNKAKLSFEWLETNFGLKVK